MHFHGELVSLSAPQHVLPARGGCGEQGTGKPGSALPMKLKCCSRSAQQKHHFDWLLLLYTNSSEIKLLWNIHIFSNASSSYLSAILLTKPAAVFLCVVLQFVSHPMGRKCGIHCISGICYVYANLRVLQDLNWQQIVNTCFPWTCLPVLSGAPLQWCNGHWHLGIFFPLVSFPFSILVYCSWPLTKPLVYEAISREWGVSVNILWIFLFSPLCLGRWS